MGFRHHHCKITKIHICQQQSRSLSIQSIHPYTIYTYKISNSSVSPWTRSTVSNSKILLKHFKITFQNHCIFHFPFIEISSVRFFRFFSSITVLFIFDSFVIKKERVYIAIENENEVVLTLFYFISKAIWEKKLHFPFSIHCVR